MPENITRLEKYIFKVPDWKYSVIFSILLSMAIGIAAFDYGIVRDTISGFVLIGIPSLLSSFVTFLVARPMTLKRSFFLSFFCVFIIGIFTTASSILSTFIHGKVTLDGFILSLGIIFGIRLLILLGIVDNDVPRMIFPASLQSLFGGVFLLGYTNEVIYYENLVASCIIFSVAACLFVRYLDAPLKRFIGISGLDFIRYFIDEEFPENFFEDMGEPVDVPITILSFKSRSTQKALFLIPSVHPGPAGGIGGGDLPSKIASSMNSLVFVPHGAAHHDFNPVSEREIQKIIDASKKVLSEIEYSPIGTESVRVKEGIVKMLAQRFDSSVLLTFTTSPVPSEDLEFGIGIAATAEARVMGARYAAIIDAHNCGDPDAEDIALGTRLSHDIIRAASKASELVFSKESGEIKLGVSKRDPINTKEMGDLGIRTAVFEISGQKTAYILLDGNNIVPGLREKIIKALPVEEAEIMTTDTHSVNRKTAFNYIGMETDHDELREVIKESVEEAIADLEPVEVGIKTEIARDIFVFGSHKTAHLKSTVNTISAIGGFLALSVMIAALCLCILAFLVIP
ncbi:MAG: DUF2070 family protein [Candidatus Syntropharchaeia archaeon]